MTRAVIFDLDGTLVSFHFDVQGSRRALLEELSRRGFGLSVSNLSLPTQEILDAAKRQVDSGVVRADFGEVRRVLYGILDEFELNGSQKSEPFSDTKETLGELKRSGTRLAVVTNSGRTATIALLRRTQLLDFFEFVLTRDDVDRIKPDPDGLLNAISRLELPPTEVLFVGDSVLDILAAKRAGLRVVSVATGNYTADRLRAEGADAVLSQISDLTRMLGRGSQV